MPLSSPLRRLAALSLTFGASTLAFAADSDPDPGFSTDGKAFADWAAGLMADQPVAITANAAGEVYVAGTVNSSNRDFAVAKFLRNGTLDAGFGFQGLRTVGFDYVADGTDSLEAVFVESDGKVVLLGRAEVAGEIVARAPPAMARLNAAGNTDTGFGSNGRRSYTQNPWPGPAIYTQAAGRQRDGKYLLAGYCTNCTTSGYNAFVLRLNSNGDPDTGFGSNGWATVVMDGDTRIEAIRQDWQGRIVLGGARVSTGLADPLLVRLLANGQPDSSFGGGTGRVRVTTNLPSTTGGDWGISAIAPARGGDIYFAVHNRSPLPVNRTGVMHLQQDGAVDSSFGVSGFRDLTRDEGSRINSLALRSDGRLVAAGSIKPTTAEERDFYLARLLPGGGLDTSFDGNGVLRIEVGSGDDGATHMQLVAGKPVLAGFGTDGDGPAAAVLRMQSDLVFRDGLQ